MSKISSKELYERPTIVKVETHLSQKHAVSVRASTTEVRKEIDGVMIDDLVTEFGSPLFVYSEKMLIKQYQRAYKAFNSRYPKVQFAWSYKTNYLKAICSVFHKQGAIAEVVSDFEYAKARKLGIKGKDIIYNGPYKPFESLLTAVKEGAKIHIDSIEEINDLEQISRDLDQPIKVAIRINLNTGIYPQWSRFGFNLESGQAMDVVERIKAGGRLEINGIHSHIGTFVLDPAAYGRAVDKLMAFAAKMKDESNFHMEYLDLGGGFASKNHLKGMYQPPETGVPDIEAYAEEICKALHRNCNSKNMPQLYLETGRHLVDEAGFLITSVVASKVLNDSRVGYTLDAGVNLLYTSAWYNFKVEVDREENGMLQPSILYGPLCMNIDVVQEHILLPRLKRGTRLIMSPVGAYNVTQAMQFIRYRPAVVLIRSNGEVDLMRRIETLEDIEIAENLPESLAL
jgi:diaminopimelate decarboxylase